MRARSLFRHTLLWVSLASVATGPLLAHAGDPDDRYWTQFSSFEGEIGFVDAIFSAGDDLYVGGHFVNVDGIAASNCAMWDGSAWWPVGGGVGNEIMTNVVHVILVDGDDIYVGGMFDQVGGLWPVSNIAHWDGASWNSMAGGTDRAIRTIVKGPNGDLYAGGEFTSAGGVAARGVARWDGREWHALGEGINNHVNAIAARGDDVYVGGAFSSAGGQRIGFLARWDGSAWHALERGVDGFVNALEFSGRDLYVGGDFRTAGGKLVRGIAMWNGASWFPLGGGISSGGTARVRAICADGRDVYIGGFFTFAGDEPANYIARWDGTAWSPLGSGLDKTVKNMVKHGDDLYVTGEFQTAGGVSSPYFAKWNRPVVVIERFEAEPRTGAVMLEWESTVNGPFQGYRVYRRTSGGEETVISGEAVIGDTATGFTDGTAAPGVTYEYSLAVVRDDGSELYSDWVQVTTLAVLLIVGQNHPNPFNPGTRIDYTLPATSHVELTIFDARGRRVRVLVNDTRPAGPNAATWDGLSASGEPMASGVYFYRLRGAGASQTKKMVLLR